MNPEINEYLADAMCFLKRVAGILKPGMSKDETIDGVLFFAFGVERLFKAILHDVNPVFVLEKYELDVVGPALYLHRLTPSAKGRAESAKKNGKRIHVNVVAYNDAMLAAERFSETVMKNQATLGHLADLRNVIAHRSLSQFDHFESCRFCLKHFVPLVESFAAEFGFEPELCYAGNRLELKRMSDEVADLEQKVAELIAKHQSIWSKRNNPETTARIAQEVADTRIYRGRRVAGSGKPFRIPCPVCGNDAIVIHSAYWDPTNLDSDDHSDFYVSALMCKFCDLTLDEQHHYEIMDHFALTERLYQTYPRLG